jgi:hypothetical protein
MKARTWAPAKPQATRPTDVEKQRIVAACDAFIRDVLKPRFLPRIEPTEWNYPVDIHGAWAVSVVFWPSRRSPGVCVGKGRMCPR